MTTQSGPKAHGLTTRIDSIYWLYCNLDRNWYMSVPTFSRWWVDFIGWSQFTGFFSDDKKQLTMMVSDLAQPLLSWRYRKNLRNWSFYLCDFHPIRFQYERFRKNQSTFGIFFFWIFLLVVPSLFVCSIFASWKFVQKTATKTAASRIGLERCPAWAWRPNEVGGCRSRPPLDRTNLGGPMLFLFSLFYGCF